MLAVLIHVFGAKKVMRLFPPVVTGPIIILIGINLSTSALDNILANQATHPYAFVISVFAILVIIACNIWGKGMVRILPILIGIVAAYVFACSKD